MSESGAGARILVVDDEAPIRRFLRISLQSEGYAVIEADSAQAALALAATRTPDLVVLDLGLPDADGKEVLRELRGWSRVPVIVLSVRTAESEKVLALDDGANDYVTKPFGIQEFLARVRNLLRQRHADAADGVYDDGHLRVDAPRWEVLLEGRAVHLSRKEFALLKALAAYPGRLLTQRQLLRDLWGPSHAEDTHYLRVIIGKLRQKLGDDADEPRYIETVPGVGYRFADRRGGGGG